jgi:hypothetical protein
MALHFVNEPTAGASIGQAFGSGIGNALNLLAQHKMQEIMDQKQIHNNEKFIKAWNPGLSNEQVAAFARSPEFAQKAMFERGVSAPESNQQQVAQEQQQQYQPQQDMQQFAPQQQEQQQAKPALSDVLKMLYGAEGKAPGQVQVPTIEPNIKSPMRQQALKAAAKQEVMPAQSVAQQSPITGTQAIAKQAGFALGPTPEDRRHQEKLAVQREDTAKKDIASKYKETKELRHTIVQAGKTARQDLKDLDRLEELSHKGDLSTPGYVEMLHRVGLDIPALMTPDSEEFQKIQANFLRNAKQYFGGRISNYEVEQFLKTIPSLSQSPEGRSRVIANLKYVARASLEHNNALKEVVAENGGVPPYDLEERIDDKVEKRMDTLAEKLKKDLAKPVPKGQNKYITALMAGIGSSVKPVAKAALGAAGGAIAGSKFGPVGATLGALGGGFAGLKDLV